MKRKLFLFLFVIPFILSACKTNSINPDKQAAIKEVPATQDILSSTLEVSRAYVDLRERTDEILTQPASYADYETWNESLSKLIIDWESYEQLSKSLEEKADNYIGEKIVLNLIPYASAASNKEINDVFDKAPAGKKIKTLANFLGVDAKRAYTILKQTQNEVEAEAWNEAGDTFKKLENSAVVIKDGCKVTAFVGGVILTGGAAGFAAAGTVAKTAVIVSGADLVLEVTEDAAHISLGDNNKISEIAGDIRKITEPAASILAIADMPKNLTKGVDKLNAWVFGADQFRSVVQDGKIIGISLPAYVSEKNGLKPEMVVLEPGSENEWKNDQGSAFENFVAENNNSLPGDLSEEPSFENQATSDNEEELINNFGAEAQAKGADGAVTATFIGPEESSFVPSQARMWEVKVDNFDNQGGLANYLCDFVFYMDGAKYAEMLDVRGCAFTGTLIGKSGNLKAEVNVKFMKNRAVYDENGKFVELTQDVYDSIKLSREFKVGK